ncbi:hypothetical protein S40293_11099 [Stachybotrys chartarum IBT 40293]|nr:hypothetical protein S40293_11099 [Stachybotrys chartarum IBT 40293]
MDWTPNTFLTDNGLEEFECDIQSDEYCTVLYKLGDNDDGDVERLVLKTDEDWKTFENLPIFAKDDDDDAATGSATLPAGVCMLRRAPSRFCPRAPPPFPDFPSITAELYEMCMTSERWERVVDKFRLHSLLIEAIKRKTTSAHAVVSDATGFRDVEDNSDVSDVDNGRQPVVLHTVMTSPDLCHNFAMSSTYFVREHLSLAVFLGSTTEQVDQVELLLHMGAEAIGHPYLALGLCLELLLRRLRRLVEKNVRDCIAITRRMEIGGRDSGRTPMGWKLINEMRYSRIQSQQIKEEIETTKRHLHQVWPDGKESMSAVTARFHDRFSYIMIELDGLLSRSQIYAEEMVFNTNTASTWSPATLEANSSAQTSVGLAIAAMFYLPMSTLATIISMPVFDFENSWVDWRFRPVNDSSSRDDPVGAGSSTSAPVFSGYFWIWLIFAFVLTLITLWTFLRNRRGEVAYDAKGTTQDVPGFSREVTSPWKNAISLLATAITRFFKIFRDGNALSPPRGSKQSSSPPSSPARASGSAAVLRNWPRPSVRNRQPASPSQQPSRQQSQVLPDNDIEMVPVVTASSPTRARPPSVVSLRSNSRTQFGHDPGIIV